MIEPKTRLACWSIIGTSLSTLGGLAASLAEGLAERLAHPLLTVVVEPQACPCVGLALSVGHSVQVEGEIQLEEKAGVTSTDICGWPAHRSLRRAGTAT